MPGCDATHLAQFLLVDGVTVDIYNLHKDAGATDADQKERASNLAQGLHSADKAVIVMGDTNTSYTRELDTIREFLEGQKLTDSEPCLDPSWKPR
jgi:endonuclease/exonuclease/phosphatase (EEP) superfamily protein YafD